MLRHNRREFKGREFKGASQRREFKGVATVSHEDFDPLRVRPYVRLPDPPPDPLDDVVGAAYPTAPAAAVRVTGAGAGAGAVEPGAVGEQPGRGPAGQQPEPEPEPVRTGPVETAPVETGPVETAPSPLDPVGEPEPSARRRRPFTVIAGGVAAVAVLGGAAFAAGLFSPDGPAEDQALPDVMTSAPDTPVQPPPPSTSASVSASPSGTADSRPTAPSSAAGQPKPSTPTGTRSGQPSAGTGAATASAPDAPAAQPSQAPPPAPSGTPDAGQHHPAAPSAAVLRQGDSGPGVVELQQRLAQLTLYRGRADGRYDGDVADAVRTFQSWMGVEGDPPGVYGAPTRRALESMTRQP